MKYWTTSQHISTFQNVYVLHGSIGQEAHSLSSSTAVEELLTVSWSAPPPGGCMGSTPHTYAQAWPRLALLCNWSSSTPLMKFDTWQRQGVRSMLIMSSFLRGFEATLATAAFLLPQASPHYLPCCRAGKAVVNCMPNTTLDHMTEGAAYRCQSSI